MTTYFLDQFDDIPAGDRLSCFLERSLAKNYESRSAMMAIACGYTNAHVVHMWIEGRTPVPIKVIPAIASFLGKDIADILPLWIAAHAGGEEQDVLWQASKRMLSVWEMGLIHTARDIYRGDEGE